MTPGSWEYTMGTTVPGVPLTPSVTMTMCLSAADVPYAVATSERGRKGSCRYENLRHVGKQTRYEMVCAGSEPVRGRFEFESTATTVSCRGVIDTGETTLKQRWTGRRIGDCG